MVIGIIGENCTGKSTLANALKESVSAEIVTGKDDQDALEDICKAVIEKI